MVRRGAFIVLPIAIVAALTIGSGAARAEVAWVLYGAVPKPEFICHLDAFRYIMPVVVANRSASEATVVAEHVSNGLPSPFPGGTATLAPGSVQTFYSPPGAGVGVVRLSVPQGVTIASRMEIRSEKLCVPPVPGPFWPDRGIVHLPKFTTLKAPFHEHFVLGTDLGVQSARTNVGFYNGGEVQANVRIRLIRACDDVVVSERNETVPPLTYQQFTLVPEPYECATGSNGSAGWVLYSTSVIADQPSLVIISTISNTEPIRVPLAIHASETGTNSQHGEITGQSPLQ